MNQGTNSAVLGSGMRVAGIDPGSRFTGWGVITEVAGSLRLLDCGIIRASACGQQEFSSRLTYIYHSLCMALKPYRPDVAAIEQAFMAQNAQSALKLGQARGVAVAACASLGMEIFDYEPTMVKKALTGAGRAEKDQVAFMVKRILNVKEAAWELDTSDALSVAICHFSHAKYLALTNKIRKSTGNTA